jgi:hypothetical protein
MSLQSLACFLKVFDTLLEALFVYLFSCAQNFIEGRALCEFCACLSVCVPFLIGGFVFALNLPKKAECSVVVLFSIEFVGLPYSVFNEPLPIYALCGLHPLSGADGLGRQNWRTELLPV